MIQDLVMEENLSNDLFDFVMSYPQEEVVVDDPPTPTDEESISTPQLVEESILVDQHQDVPLIVPLLKADPEFLKLSPPIQVEHIDFIFGDFLEDRDHG